MTQKDVYTEPPPLSTELRIYSNPICPFAQRVRLIAAAKGVNFEEINIHLKVKPQWYLEKINPLGQVPTIEHNGHLIRESLIAFDYIDEVFGEESLWPKDPFEKAKSRILVNDFGNKFIPNYYKHYGTPEEEHTQEVVKFLQQIEEILDTNERSDPSIKPFLGGMKGKPLAADFLLWPWLERLEPLCLINTNFGSLVTKEKFPKFFKYLENMKQESAVQQSYLPPEAHLAFIKGFKENGTHDYSCADLQGTGVTIYTRKE